MVKRTVQIVWFRRDLRINDNEILSEAILKDKETLPCFIVDPWFYQQSEISAIRVKFLFESLENLDRSLKQLGSKLYLFEGESVAVIQELTEFLIQQDKAPKLYFNRDVQVQYGIDRDSHILQFYQAQGLEVHLGQNNFIQEKENYDTLWQEYHDYQQRSLHQTSSYINTPQLNLDLIQLTFTELWQKYCPNRDTLSNKFIGGENAANQTLNSFLNSRYRGYHWKMSRPYMAQQGATSHLSPHLDFGTISARSIYQAAIAVAKSLPSHSKNNYSLKAFLDRIRWHDKFSQRHYYHPELAFENRYSEFDEYYSNEQLTGQQLAYFKAWCEGNTGYPMVDASMRQLNISGWMSFRMRAMCVTFLCINCGVSWHHGAKYFMSRLVDGNIAINHWQWQAQAGITNPMSNTFRIYNPTKNLQDKDPDLKFVHYWIPELRGHRIRQILSGEFTSSYPQPILDWKQTRKINGKIVSNLRKQVRDRLEKEGGEELKIALGAKETIEKYVTAKDKQYRSMKSTQI